MQGQRRRSESKCGGEHAGGLQVMACPTMRVFHRSRGLSRGPRKHQRSLRILGETCKSACTVPPPLWCYCSLFFPVLPLHPITCHGPVSLLHTAFDLTVSNIMMAPLDGAGFLTSLLCRQDVASLAPLHGPIWSRAKNTHGLKDQKNLVTQQWM